MIFMIFIVSYICMTCKPSFLKSVKREADYKEAKIMSEEKQGGSNPSSWPDLANKAKENLQDEDDHSIVT